MSIKITKVPICRHLLTTGRRCKSPAVKPSAFCFHHRKLHGTRPRTIHLPAAPALVRFSPNPLHDRASIQQALHLVLNGLSSGHLACAPAGKMLTVLQRASLELARQ